MDDRLKELSADEFERFIARKVERAFEAAFPDPAAEVPFIGGCWPPLEYHDELRLTVIRALRAQRWFEQEAPPWAQPLPLTFEDCIARYNGPNRGSRRGSLVGNYGVMLRQMQWRYENAWPFEVYCAHVLMG